MSTLEKARFGRVRALASLMASKNTASGAKLIVMPKFVRRLESSAANENIFRSGGDVAAAGA